MSPPTQWPPCGGCGQRRDGMAGVTAAGDLVDSPARPARPTRGAFVVCAFCADINVVDDGPLGVLLRKPTDDELDQFVQDPAKRAVVAEIRAMLRRAGLN